MKMQKKKIVSLLLAIILMLVPAGVPMPAYALDTVAAVALSDWTPVAEVPDGAEIVNRRWDYNETQYTTGKNSVLNGWTRYDQQTTYGTWGAWSGWSDAYASASENRQVESQRLVTGYNMFVYQTQEAVDPFHRVFRSYSINRNYSGYGARASYGEFLYETFASKAEVDGAARYQENVMIQKNVVQNGYNRGGGVMYVVETKGHGEKRAYFIKNEINETQYRYRERSQETTYYFKKTVAKISYSRVTSSNTITDVVEKVQYRLAAADRELQNFEQPDALKVDYGTQNNATALGLPQQVTLITSAGSEAATVKWAPSAPDYNLGLTVQQSFAYSGTAVLPAGVTNPRNLSLAVSVKVTVAAKSYSNSNKFLMGEDNYRFSNSAASFGYAKNYSVPLARYEAVLPRTEAMQYYNYDNPWGGSCYGFASSSLRFNDASMQPGEYGAGTTYGLATPASSTAKVTEMMEIHQVSQRIRTLQDYTYRTNKNNYAGLISAANAADGSGLLVMVFGLINNSMGGHAVVAYNIVSKGNGVYDLSIYDNNYPNDTARKMTVDTNRRTWSYQLFSGTTFGTGNSAQDYFSFHTAAQADEEITAALNQYHSTNGGNMTIIVPAAAGITFNGTPVVDVPGAYEIIPLQLTAGQPEHSKVMWSVPTGVYDVQPGGTGVNTATFFNDEASFQVTTDAVASIEGSLGADSYARIVSASAGQIEIIYMAEASADSPLTISGAADGNFMAAVEAPGSDKLLLTGTAQVNISNGTQSKNITIRPNDSVSVDSSLNINADSTSGGRGGGGTTPADPSVGHRAISKADLSFIYGANRMATSVVISQKGWQSADMVILAPGAQANLIDALAAAPLAGQEDVPILLSGNTIDPIVISEIKRLGATKVIAVGALSQNVIRVLQTEIIGLNIEVLQGGNRWETAALIGSKITQPKGTFVIGYNAVADAVSVASWAAANSYTIQFAQVDGSFQGNAALGGYIIGGPTMVKDIAGFTRIYGENRYTTNLAVRQALPFEYDTIYTADGLTLVDALTGSALAAKTKSAIVLAPGNNPEGTDFGKITSTTRVFALGGLK
jgi:putative cell wall-binding protein